tara:strand:- start:140555 stop:142474 length:1920 start_codon:yes stop_codon:yes gene_type:complete
MQFKNPEILWSLLLLIIPILIHLFQLRRFKKTPFTNVKMLQKVVAESQKSRTLKNWLLLLTRLLLFIALILAFAQPFFAKQMALLDKETVIYLDNSFSMQAKKGNTSLLENAIQELLKNVPQNKKISIFTNENTYADITLKEIQNEFLTIPFSLKQLSIDEVKLKAQTLFSNQENTIKNLVFISDFQQSHTTIEFDTISSIQLHLIKLSPSVTSNIAIDSVFIAKDFGSTIELNASLFSATEIKNIPVAVFNDNQLIAKTAAIFDQHKRAIVSFSLPNTETILGRIEIMDTGLDYDNQFFFSLNKKEKIKVLAISEVAANFLKKIYTEDEFSFLNINLKNLNYSIIASQNLIVLNELESIPEALQQALKSFSRNNGIIIIIPNNMALLTSYNSFLSDYAISLSQKINAPQEITTINFDHPLYQDVFDKRVTNFQYPKTENYYPIKTNLTTILSYANGDSFLSGKKGIYMFSAPLSETNSNFKNSPLIVPTFYKMGVESFEQEQLYNIIGASNTLDIAVKLSKDDVLKIAKKESEFIPLQQPFLNKVSLTFIDNPKEDGNYQINNKKTTLKHISFNYPRSESKLEYLNFNELPATSKQESIQSLFEDLEKDNRLSELWKWFVILALIFALIEMGIQKYFK